MPVSAATDTAEQTDDTLSEEPPEADTEEESAAALPGHFEQAEPSVTELWSELPRSSKTPER